MSINGIIAAEKTRILEQIASLAEEARKLDKLYDVIEFLDGVERVEYSDSRCGYTEILHRVADNVIDDRKVVFELEYSDREWIYDITPMTIIEAAKWYQKATAEYNDRNYGDDIDMCYSSRAKRETPAKNRRHPYRGRAKEEI